MDNLNTLVINFLLDALEGNLSPIDLDLLGQVYHLHPFVVNFGRHDAQIRGGQVELQDRYE